VKCCQVCEEVHKKEISKETAEIFIHNARFIVTSIIITAIYEVLNTEHGLSCDWTTDQVNLSTNTFDFHLEFSGS
jgi:hypothetical protein